MSDGCPFKYEEDEMSEYVEWSGVLPYKTGKKYMACDLRNGSECVGEDVCPIVKK